MKILEILSNLKGNPGIKNLENTIVKQGWEVLGRGSHGVVAQHPDKPFVLKIFSDTSGYKEFIEFAQANRGNVHLPRILRKMKPIPGTRFISVGLERLEPWDAWEDAESVDNYLPNICFLCARLVTANTYVSELFIDIINEQLDSMGGWDYFERAVGNRKLGRLWTKIGDPDQQWKQVVTGIFSEFSAGSLDFSDNNIMRRGRTLVITDPIV